MKKKITQLCWKNKEAFFSAFFFIQNLNIWIQIIEGCRIANKSTLVYVIYWLRPQAACHHDDVIKWKHFPRYWPFVRGNHPVTGEFPAQRPVTRSFGVFFDLRLNKRLGKQSRRWWFEMPSHSLWRHCHDKNSGMQLLTNTLTSMAVGINRRRLHPTKNHGCNYLSIS